MRISSLISIISTLLASSQVNGDRDADKCIACYGLADRINAGLAETEGRANEEISIGSKLDANGNIRPDKKVLYGNSDRRLHDVLDNVCVSNEKRAYCNELLHEQEDLISEWFKNRRSAVSFANAICDAHIKGCNAAKVGEAKKATASVEEDTKSSPTIKKEEPAKKQSTSAPPRKEQPQQQPKQQTKGSETPSFDVIALGTKILNRMRGNINRIRYLSMELYNEIKAAMKVGGFQKVKTMIMEKSFYQKYWIVFAAFFFVIYFIFSLFESLFSKPTAPKRTKSAKQKKSSSTVKASGTTATKKDE